MSTTSPYRATTARPPAPPPVALPRARGVAALAALGAVGARAIIAAFGTGRTVVATAIAVSAFALVATIGWGATLRARWRALRGQPARATHWARATWSEAAIAAVGGLAVVATPWTDLTVVSLAQATLLGAACVATCVVIAVRRRTGW